MAWAAMAGGAVSGIGSGLSAMSQWYQLQNYWNWQEGMNDKNNAFAWKQQIANQDFLREQLTLKYQLAGLSVPSSIMKRNAAIPDATNTDSGSHNLPGVISGSKRNQTTQFDLSDQDQGIQTGGNPFDGKEITAKPYVPSSDLGSKIRNPTNEDAVRPMNLFSQIRKHDFAGGEEPLNHIMKRDPAELIPDADGSSGDEHLSYGSPRSSAQSLKFLHPASPIAGKAASFADSDSVSTMSGAHRAAGYESVSDTDTSSSKSGNSLNPALHTSSGEALGVLPKPGTSKA